MSRSYDVVVVGIAAMGSAIVYQLAKAGARVLGIDRFAPPHVHGSTHGDSRITRLAVGEGAEYVPLAIRSHELWREIEALTGEVLLTVTGGVVISVPGGRGQHGADDFLATTIAAARAHGVRHEVLDSAALAERFGPFALCGDERGMFEPSAGFVRPEAAVAAQLRLAREQGAELRTGERVISAGERRVVTDAGMYTAETIVLAAGPWLTELRPELASAFTVSRQVLHWFALAPGAYEAHRDLPVFIWITGDGPEEFFYGFPAIDGPNGGLKVASEQFQAATTPAACGREQSTPRRASTRAPPTAASQSALTPATPTCWSSRRAPATASSTPRPSAKRSRSSRSPARARSTCRRSGSAGISEPNSRSCSAGTTSPLNVRAPPAGRQPPLPYSPSPSASWS
jgi:sarcosine oxidase